MLRPTATTVTSRLLPAALACAVFCAGMASGSALAQDAAAPAAEAPKAEAKKASPFPVAAAANTSWGLEFTPQTPKAVGVKLADGTTKWYWYMPFHVENREDEAHLFVPLIQVVTDTGRIHNCNEPVPQEAYNAIYKRCGNALTVPIVEIAGPMKPGKDFAHDSLAIWPADEGEDVDDFSVYVSGIYGETKPVNDPATGKQLMAVAKDAITGEVKKDAAGNPLMQPVELKRTLRLYYTTPGTGKLSTKTDVKLSAQDDVMR